ncbi:ribosomal RNA processing protein 1 homolog [Rhodamnia argentea]|uniref:Ribosomal RNA processing protein 1 homolog n=1 Tax=Rhodamnia argentea TaxID=178133 RepID=A0ABM3H8M2_9MYRT|nr:ribosomal RNA processing protein 1 homolog [Rhodamnia argentea]
MDGAQKGPSLIKQLASCNQSARERSLRVLLKTWLPAQSSLSDDGMKKLWKGLFYCVWHADKVPYQTHLADRLSSLLLSLELPLSVQYFSVFVLTMRREWVGIDVLRLDKFYVLIRRFLSSFFALMRKYSWDMGLVGRLVGVLEERALLADDKFQGNGVNYHIATVYLEELRPFLPVKAEALEVLLNPFLNVMGRSLDKVLLGKIKSNVFDVLLRMGKGLLDAKKSGVELDLGDDLVVYGTIALNMRFSSKLFELGSSSECNQGNRKLLFGLHEEFLKLEKELVSLEFEVPIPYICANDDEEEVPDLIPVGSETKTDDADLGFRGNAMNGAKITKKLKKAKKAIDGMEAGAKRKKKKKTANKKDVNLDNSTMDVENANPGYLISEFTTDEFISNGDMIFDESMMSNLQMEFERVAAAEGLRIDVPNDWDADKDAVNGDGSKKRKREKTRDGQRSLKSEMSEEGDDGDAPSAKSGDKSVKRVRFAMKDNLVWKPHTPLPPQNLRLPPSATPRGSALKKGLSPGPIMEMPPLGKKARQRARAVKKVRKTIKSISPAVKRLKKLKALSP